MAKTKLPVREDLAKLFLDSLYQDKLPWAAGWVGQRPVNPVSGSVYRGINRLWLSQVARDNGWEDHRWCTYNQAKEKGWQVRKGETSVAKVEYWAYFDTEQKKLLSWSEVRRLLAADPTYQEKLRLNCRTYTVFNGCQIDGIPELEHSRLDIGDYRMWRDTLLSNMGVGFREEGNEAYYLLNADQLTLPPEKQFNSVYDYMAILLHEAGHATGHPSRLNREMSEFFGSQDYAREELRAEIASAFVSQELGLPLGDNVQRIHQINHAAYIQSWISVLEKDPNELMKAINDAEEIAEYLIEKGEFDMLKAVATYELGDVQGSLTSLPSQDGLCLHIYGQGKTPSFFSPAARPYQQYIDSIRQVVIDSGVTEIGKNILCDFPALEEISWAETIQKADPYTLRNCPNLKQVRFSGVDLQSRSNREICSPNELMAAASQYPELNKEQLSEVIFGIREALAPEQLALFAAPEFTSAQMHAIRYSIAAGMPPEQIQVQANPSFDPIQMDIIRTGFLSGLTMEQVCRYARPELTSHQMLDAYLAIKDGRSWDPSWISHGELSDEDIAAHAASVDIENEFWEMNAFLERGGNIAQLSDFHGSSTRKNNHKSKNGPVL